MHHHQPQQLGTDTAAHLDHDGHTGLDSAQPGPPAEVTDPVCGMRLSPAGAATHREVDSVTFFFCSAHCAASFDTDPDRYATPAVGTP